MKYKIPNWMHNPDVLWRRLPRSSDGKLLLKEGDIVGYSVGDKKVLGVFLYYVPQQYSTIQGTEKVFCFFEVEINTGELQRYATYMTADELLIPSKQKFMLFGGSDQ